MGDEEDVDEGNFGGLYENGHWVWDENTQALVFVSDHPPKPPEAITISTKAPTGTIEFRDDIDLIEQLRFRRRYQRKIKPGQPDVVTLQDVKDLALYTAPLNLLSPLLINMLHLSTTERFLRALIFSCQYYLQVADEMTKRILEADTKVRTPDCEIVEREYMQDICDLRLLVAKEYCTMLIGGNDTKKFHHMGVTKKRRSLSDKDARLIETLLRMSVQIVWLALGRKSFHQIELEVSRLFKSEIFNSTEHILKTGYIAKMTKEERKVLLGQCLNTAQKLNTKSPLMNEVFCHRPIDYRLMGIGVINYETLPTRFRFMQMAISCPEEELETNDISVGILGIPRNKFDTMLRPLPNALSAKSKASMMSAQMSGKSTGSMKKSAVVITRIYDDIVLPPKDIDAVEEPFPESFPDTPEVIRPCSEVQLRRWLNRLNRLLAGLHSTTANENKI